MTASVAEITGLSDWLTNTINYEIIKGNAIWRFGLVLVVLLVAMAAGRIVQFVVNNYAGRRAQKKGEGGSEEPAFPVGHATWLTISGKRCSFPPRRRSTGSPASDPRSWCPCGPWPRGSHDIRCRGFGRRWLPTCHCWRWSGRPHSSEYPAGK